MGRNLKVVTLARDFRWPFEWYRFWNMERLEACKNYYSKTDIAPDNEKLKKSFTMNMCHSFHFVLLLWMCNDVLKLTPQLIHNKKNTRFTKAQKKSQHHQHNGLRRNNRKCTKTEPQEKESERVTWRKTRLALTAGAIGNDVVKFFLSIRNLFL